MLSGDEGGVKTRTESSQWTIFELSYREFCDKLGIPPDLSVVTVSASAYSGKVEIRALPKR